MSAGRLHVRVAGFTFVANPDTDVPSADFPQMVGDVSWTSQVDEADLWPSWRSAVATFSVMFDSAQEAAAVTKGEQVILAWSDDAANTLRTGIRFGFDGLVTDVVLVPTLFRGVPCVRADVTAADWATARLGDVRPVGTLPAQNANERLEALLGLSGDGWIRQSVPAAGVSVSTLNPPMAALTLDGSRTLYDILREHTRIHPLDWTATFATGGVDYPDGAGRGRYIIEPLFSAGTNPIVKPFIGWQATILLKDIHPAYLPGRLAATPEAGAGSWGVSVPGTGPQVGYRTVDASRVELGPGWANRKGLLPTAVQVNSPALNWLKSNGDTPQVVEYVDAGLLTDAVGVLSLADVLCPEEGGEDWWVDTWTWRVSDETLPKGQDWWPKFGDIMALAGVPVAYQPSGKPWIVGTVFRYTFRMRQTSVQLDVTLKPVVRAVLRNVTSPYWMDWAHCPTGLALQNVNHRDTFDDLRLVNRDLP